jgi:hypothetical protein
MRFEDAESGIIVIFPDGSSKDTQKAFEKFRELVDLTKVKSTSGAFSDALKQFNEESEKGMDEFIEAIRKDNPKGETDPDGDIIVKEDTDNNPKRNEVDAVIMRVIDNTTKCFNNILDELHKTISGFGGK